MSVFESICTHLAQRGIQYRTVHHEPTTTSEESAHARGEDISVGGKAIVLKVDEYFRLFVLSAALKVDSKKVKQHFLAKNSRFATKEELMELTGLVPGSVPPFGRPILSLDLFVDPSVFRNDKIAFNAGTLTDSIIMSTSDYRTAADAVVFEFSML
jgi:prolyl-tRNA editing enzyme YbaK/EbsC (Cys-tRNA(Pro) deacylase)